ncbi:sugar phosphate isomerase/epimerase [soil metagenome]
MHEPWTRRKFIATGGRAAAAAAVGASTVAGCTGLHAAARPAGLSTAATGPEPPFRISLAQWSLHRTLRAGDIDHLDLARVARDEFAIDAIEYVNIFFKDRAEDRDYLAEMNRRAADHGVYQHLIMCDGEGRLGDPDAALRRQAVENHHKWVDAAVVLGCAMIRVNAASQGTWDEQADLAADGLRQLTEYGAAADIDVVVENHGGLSSNGAWLADVMKRVDHPRCGTLPDFGNFRIGPGEMYDRYVGVTELMPFAKAVSAKSHDFDDDGNETGTDYRRMLKIVTAAGYSGWIGIEYEGSRLPEREGIAATKRLLETVRTEMTTS